MVLVTYNYTVEEFSSETKKILISIESNLSRVKGDG